MLVLLARLVVLGAGCVYTGAVLAGRAAAGVMPDVWGLVVVEASAGLGSLLPAVGVLRLCRRGAGCLAQAAGLAATALFAAAFCLPMAAARVGLTSDGAWWFAQICWACGALLGGFGLLAPGSRRVRRAAADQPPGASQVVDRGGRW